jgi:choline transport protein
MGREDGIMLNVQHSSLEASSLNVPSRREGTAQDKQDMWRVGRDQELNVRNSAHIFRAPNSKP